MTVSTASMPVVHHTSLGEMTSKLTTRPLQRISLVRRNREELDQRRWGTPHGGTRHVAQTKPEGQGPLKLTTLLSVETHRRAVTGNTKSREVTGGLAGTAPSSTAHNSVTRPEIPENVGRAT